MDSDERSVLGVSSGGRVCASVRDVGTRVAKNHKDKDNKPIYMANEILKMSNIETNNWLHYL